MAGKEDKPLIGVILRIMVNSATTTILFTLIGLPAADVMAIIMMFDVGMVLQEELIDVVVRRRRFNENKTDGSHESAGRRSA